MKGKRKGMGRAARIAWFVLVVAMAVALAAAKAVPAVGAIALASGNPGMAVAVLAAAGAVHVALLVGAFAWFEADAARRVREGARGDGTGGESRTASADERELGVREPFTTDELRRAYRKRMKELHPDAGGDEEAAKAVTAAYGRLKATARKEDAK